MILQVLSENTQLLENYVGYAGPIVLLQNAVYVAPSIVKIFPQASVYALRNDYMASGLDSLSQVKLIEADEWVDICSKYHPVVTVQ